MTTARKRASKIGGGIGRGQEWKGASSLFRRLPIPRSLEFKWRRRSSQSYLRRCSLLLTSSSQRSSHKSASGELIPLASHCMPSQSTSPDERRPLLQDHRSNEEQHEQQHQVTTSKQDREVKPFPWWSFFILLSIRLVEPISFSLVTVLLQNDITARARELINFAFPSSQRHLSVHQPAHCRPHRKAQ